MGGRGRVDHSAMCIFWRCFDSLFSLSPKVLVSLSRLWVSSPSILSKTKKDRNQKRVRVTREPLHAHALRASTQSTDYGYTQQQQPLPQNRKRSFSRRKPPHTPHATPHPLVYNKEARRYDTRNARSSTHVGGTGWGTLNRPRGESLPVWCYC